MRTAALSCAVAALSDGAGAVVGAVLEALAAVLAGLGAALLADEQSIATIVLASAVAGFLGDVVEELETAAAVEAAGRRPGRSSGARSAIALCDGGARVKGTKCGVQGRFEKACDDERRIAVRRHHGYTS